MINPVAARLLTPAPTNNKATSRAATERPDHERAPAGLAAEIMADGGLGFLQARLEEKLNESLGTADTPAATGAFDTTVDNSPAATADRIVSFALGLHGAFARQNQDLSPEELMARFETEVRRGIGEGFGRARSALGDLDLLQDEIADNVDATWQAVQERLAAFFQPKDD